MAVSQKLYAVKELVIHVSLDCGSGEFDGKRYLNSENPLPPVDPTICCMRNIKVCHNLNLSHILQRKEGSLTKYYAIYMRAVMLGKVDAAQLKTHMRNQPNLKQIKFGKETEQTIEEEKKEIQEISHDDSFEESNFEFLDTASRKLEEEVLEFLISCLQDHEMPPEVLNHELWKNYTLDDFVADLHEIRPIYPHKAGPFFYDDEFRQDLHLYEHIILLAAGRVRTSFLPVLTPFDGVYN